MNLNSIKIFTPETGIKGLKQNWKIDLVSGLLVFLLALPLSLGVAKASGFPAAMGVLTAMIGGLCTSFFNVSELTIKGPAAGLITVCAGAVADLGGGDAGWHMACGAVVVMSLLQILFGAFKLGALGDFFPHSAIHGMLAAIGIIIIAKQIPVLLGDDPMLYKGEGPLELLMDIPKFIANAHWHIAVVGIVGLIIMFSLPFVKIKAIQKIPSPMFVLLLTVPIAITWHFRETEPNYALVSIGNFWQSISLNADFSAIGKPVFWKYVMMFLFVSSLESLLTVKAMDNLDPYKRTSNPNSDLKAQGVGNFLAGLMGGLPMISEVVRSSANVTFGARTKWSNFFHGIFLLIAMVLFIPLIELVPNSALAAMLIFAGYRLASPKAFFDTYRIGKEQLVIFLVTILITLAEDLLIGIVAGIIVKILFHLSNGARLKYMFKANYSLDKIGDNFTYHVHECAFFSNLIGYKKVLSNLKGDENVVFDLAKAKLVDHSFLSFINQFKNEYEEQGGKFEIVGLDNHKSFSKHPLSTKKLKN